MAAVVLSSGCLESSEDEDDEGQETEPEPTTGFNVSEAPELGESSISFADRHLVFFPISGGDFYDGGFQRAGDEEQPAVLRVTLSSPTGTYVTFDEPYEVEDSFPVRSTGPVWGYGGRYVDEVGELDGTPNRFDPLDQGDREIDLLPSDLGVPKEYDNCWRVSEELEAEGYEELELGQDEVVWNDYDLLSHSECLPEGIYVFDSPFEEGRVTFGVSISSERQEPSPEDSMFNASDVPTALEGGAPLRQPSKEAVPRFR